MEIMEPAHGMTAPSVPLTEARRLTKHLPVNDIEQGIAHDRDRKHPKLGSFPQPPQAAITRSRTKFHLVESLISDGKTTLQVAQAILTNVDATVPLNISKDTIKALLAPAKDVIAILDVVSQIHPAVQVAVGIFKVIVKLEIDRQDNDKHIAALYYSMTDLLFVLSYLDPMFNDEDGLETMLQTHLVAICDNINRFGNFCDVYYKHKSFVRVILSTRYKDKLAHFAQLFSDQKSELEFLVTQKSTVAAIQMKHTLDTVSVKMDKIIGFLDTRSSKEEDAMLIVEQLGGENAVLENEKSLCHLASFMGDDMTPSMKYVLHTNIDEMLKSNLALFNLKVESAVSQIQDAVERSTETILLRLDSGPHDVIEDADIREVWKEMQWRLSCKIRHFVDAIHHHYAHQFGRHQLVTGDVHPDKWTLNFMSKVIFYPAIGDAIDEDGSGYVSVYAANRFFRRKPVGWTSPEWIAYWAAGSYKNMVAFKYRCLELLDSVESTAKSTLPDNRQHLKEYLGHDAIGAIRIIAESVYTDTLSFHGELSSSGYQALERLRRQRMASEVEAMKAHLSQPKYQLDSPAAVVAICGSHRVELSVLCLISLLLKRHKDILDMAQTLILSEMEFVAMTSSIYNILTAFETRFNNLLECWRQQRLDTHLQLSSFAGGMYERWYKELYGDDYDDESDDGGGSGDEENLHELVDEERPERPTDMLVYALPTQPKGSDIAPVDKHDLASSVKAKSLPRRQKEKQLEAKVAAVEDKLNNIESLLYEVLAVTKALAEK